MRNKLFLLALLPLAGCETLGDIISPPAAELFGEAVIEACDFFEHEQRQAFINEVNAHADPNQVTVVCAVDGTILVAE